MKFLRLYEKPDAGVTLLLSPKWMFLSIMTSPYAESDQGFPCYLDGFSFAGLFNIQTVSKKWPATAGLEDDRISLYDAIERSTLFEKPKMPEPEPVKEANKSMTSPMSIKSHKEVA